LPILNKIIKNKMQVKTHVLSSAILAIVFYYFTQSLTAIAVLLLSGVFIDLDHLLDFWKTRPRNPLSLKEFLHPGNYMHQNRKVFVPFHSYELIILLWLLSREFNWPLILIALSSAFTLHLILDDIGNHLKTFSYFLIYRTFKKFQVFPEISQEY